MDYPRRAISDGDVIDAGPIQLQAVHTPGHTHHHISYILRDRNGSTVGVFTGGSMLHGTTGRTDLVGDEHTQELTHAQFHSVRRLADELPDDAEVYPTHGFGSFCSATPSQWRLLHHRRPTPETTPHSPRTNRPTSTNYSPDCPPTPLTTPTWASSTRRVLPPVDLSTPEPVDPDELRRRIDSGKWVVDLRNRTAFAAGHLDGTFAFELSEVVRDLPRMALHTGALR